MTRRMAILVAVVGLMVMAFAGTALAVVKVGNAGPNRLVGTAENDTLKGRSGTDTIIGKGDSDRLYGGRGADHIKARERGRAEDDLAGCGVVMGSAWRCTTFQVPSAGRKIIVTRRALGAVPRFRQP